jgi:plastocyanin
MADISKKHAKQLRRGQERRQDLILRMGAFAIVSAGVMAAAVYLLAPVFEPGTTSITQSGNTKVVNIQAGMDGFDLKEIHVKAGENVRINLRSMDNSLHNDGGGKHQFAIDALGVNIIAQPLSLSSGTFAPIMPGEYTFYCDICCGGRVNPTMNGKLIVEA